MNVLTDPDQLATEQQTSRGRWVAGLFAGTVLWAVAMFVAHAFPVIFLGRDLVGSTYAIVALLFAPLAFGAVGAGLQIARCRLADAVSRHSSNVG